MEWLNQKHEFNKSDLKIPCLKFHPDSIKSSAIETIKVWVDLKDGPKLEHVCHESEEQFQRWVTQCCPAQVADQASLPAMVVAMHPRLSRCDPATGVDKAMPAMHLPCKEETFKHAAKQMCQHRSLSYLLRRNSTAVFQSMFVDWEERPAWGKSLVYHCRSDTASPTKKDDIAMSVTCFTKVPVTFGVVYGCTDETRDRLKKYLGKIKASGDAWHPLLLPMAFVELERSRLLDTLDTEKTKLEQRIIDMEAKLRVEADANSSEKFKPTEESEIKAMVKECDSTKIWMGVSQLKNGLESLKEQVATILAHSQTLRETVFAKPHAESPNTPDLHSAQRKMGEIVEMRLQEMTREFDSKIREHESLLGGMAMATQMEWNYYARLDTRATIVIAEATQKDGSQMRTISFLGMLFLPGTLLASLFSMDFFNWLPSGSNQVVSPWFILYIGLTAMMTALTFWRWKTWKNSEDAKAALRWRQKWKQDLQSDDQLSQLSGDTV